MKISKKELMEMIRQEAALIKKGMLEEAEAIEKVGDPIEAEMNQKDGLGDSKKALVYKDKSSKKEKEGTKASEAKMNSKDNEQGSDKDAAVAVKVDAGSKKGGKGHVSGQANANFTSKKDIQKADPSKPFDDRISDSHEMEMNKEDKAGDEKAKTYVSAGSEKGGKTHTTGQANAEVHERAPEKDSKEPTKRIAAGIEIDGSNIDLKENYTKSELKKLIMTEAKKAADNYVQNKNKESRKIQLMKEFRELCESFEDAGVSLGENEMINELFEFKRAKNDFKATHKDEIKKMKSAYKNMDASYVDVVEKLKQAVRNEYKSLAKKYGISGTNDIGVLYKDLMTLVEPMEIKTFKRQAEEGGASFKDVASGSGAGRKGWTGDK